MIEMITFSLFVMACGILLTGIGMIIEATRNK
jgi:hypothetical protein